VLLAQFVEFEGNTRGFFRADEDAQRLLGISDRSFDTRNLFFDKFEAVLHLFQLDGIHAACGLFGGGLGNVTIRSREDGSSGSSCG